MKGDKIIKKYLKAVSLILFFIILATGCTTAEENNEKREFSINETATVNKTKIKINSVKKIESECLIEFDDECMSETTPKNDFFLLIDLTLENTGNEDTSISSILSFDLKTKEGEQGSYTFLTENISTQLDGSIMPNDVLKGQIAYDVKETDEYYFYYRDSIFDKNIKFIIKKSDIE